MKITKSIAKELAVAAAAAFKAVDNDTIFKLHLYLED